MKSWAATKIRSVTCNIIHEKYGRSNLTVAFIGQSVEFAFGKLKSATTSRVSDNLFCKIPLVRKDHLGVYQFFSHLFHKKFFYPIIVAAFLSTTLFFFTHNLMFVSGVYQSCMKNLTWLRGIEIYLLLSVIIFFHEIGHSSAAKFFHAEPGEIGFAFYFIFPVFFSNVTTIWQLPAAKRNIVNLAGIYFQLIVNMLLMISYYVFSNKEMILTLILFNTISIIASLNPFFKYDGYWVFSDTFNHHNLSTKSQQVLLQMMSNNPLQAFSKAINRSASLTVYSVLNAVFWMYVYVQAGKYILIKAARLYLKAGSIQISKGQIAVDFIIPAIGLFLLIYLLAIHLIKLCNIFRYERIGVHA